MKYIKEELKKGIEMEKEHHRNAKDTEKLVLDHLSEHPYYYSDLNKAERHFRK